MICFHSWLSVDRLPVYHPTPQETRASRVPQFWHWHCDDSTKYTKKNYQKQVFNFRLKCWGYSLNNGLSKLRNPTGYRQQDRYMHHPSRQEINKSKYWTSRSMSREQLSPEWTICPGDSQLWAEQSCGWQTINRRSCTITEKAPTRAFSWLKAPTSALHLRHFARH